MSRRVIYSGIMRWVESLVNRLLEYWANKSLGSAEKLIVNINYG